MMDRRAGTGPFRVAKKGDPLYLETFALVLDATDQPFCNVDPEDCHGGDLSAAKARAQRIAESLNKTEGHLANVERLVEAARAAQRRLVLVQSVGEQALDEALEPFSEMGEQ